ncbi:MAG: hypothetical protein GY926_09090 [bacterium]|nr:hypothetical protein [bacterium]MCP4965376.1 hypothetical protein [bacterium]
MSSILRELEQVQDQLSSMCNETRDEKQTLLSRQDELRTRAARLAVAVDSKCSTQNLLAQLGGLRRQLSAFDRQRGSHTPSGKTGQTSPTSSGVRIEQKISRIEGILAERGISLR